MAKILSYLNISAALLAPLLLLGMPKAEGRVAVFSLNDSASLIARADGQIIGTGRLPQIVIATSTDADFVSRLYAAGALLVTDASLALGCNNPLSSGQKL